MKKLRKMLSIAAVVLFIASCADSTEEQEQQMNEEISEIELMEQEMGIEFFKVDLELTDDSANKITLRIASLDEEELDHFLANNNIIFKTNYSLEALTPETQKNKKSFSESINEPIKESQKTIYSEVIDKKFESNVLAYSITMEGKKDVNSRVNGNGYTYGYSHISDPWPSYFYISTYYETRLAFKGKNKWWKGWSSRTFCSIYTGICANPHYINGYDQFNVDGPYKVEAFMDYNNGTNLTYYFIR